MRASKCKGCGADIVWGVDEKGARIPLDPRPAIYYVTEDVSGRVTASRRFQREASSLAQAASLYAVNHFSTCPKASEF